MDFSLDPSATYSSALVSAYDPFVVSSQKPRAPFIKHEQAYAYVRVSYFQHLFFVEMNRASINDPSQLAQSYFPTRFHWIPKHPLKDLTYYNNILMKTQSIHFKPIFDKTNPTKLLYHSVYFDKIISEKDWGEHPSKTKNLSGFDIPYCYHDYVEAWFKFMLF
jgi:hypothetical protein